MKGLMGTDSKYNDLIKGLKGIVEYINRIMDNKKKKLIYKGLEGKLNNLTDNPLHRSDVSCLHSSAHRCTPPPPTTV